MRRASSLAGPRLRARLRLTALGALSLSRAAFGEEAEEPSSGGEGAVPRGAGGAIVRPAATDQKAPPPGVVLPVQKRFVEAAYPAEARAKGIQGTVVLLLSIDREGRVTAADVPEPIGNGFDEAARAAALSFEFEPATRGGRPIPVRIPYRYAFTLTEVEKVVEQPPTTTGNLGGRVLVSGVDAPLAAAELLVTGPDGAVRALATDPQGAFALERLPPGTYRVRISAAGFVPLDADEEVTLGEATEVTYRLSPQVQGIEITVKGERPPREVTRRTIERREMTRIPGTSGDALRSIQSLPGVARPPGLAGLLIVRGSAPQDTQVFVDGAGVPLIYHFGGLSSAVPSELLDRIDFYPGNFSARYGQVMGGIVDVALREPNVRCSAPHGKPSDRTGCFHGLAQVDLIDTRVLVQGPLGKKWTFAAGGRRSWVDAWLKPVLEQAGAAVATAPVYYDYQLIAETKPTRTSRFSARLFGSDDRLRVLVKDPFSRDPGFGGNLSFGTNFYRAQALYQAELTRRVDLYAMVAAGTNGLNFGLGPLKFEARITSITTRSELGFDVARGVKLIAGTDFLIGPYHVFVRGPSPPRPGEASPGPFTTRPLLESDERSTIFRPAWYTEALLTPTRRALIVPGLRVDFARDTGHGDVSPRVTGRYDLIGGKAEEDRPADERRRRTTLKGGVGVFHQPPQFQETNPVFGTPGLQSNRAVHFSAGAEQELTRQITVSVEGYYKDLSSLVSRSAVVGGNFLYANGGSGYVVGAETLVKYAPDDRFFGWAAYTLSRSVRKDGPGLEEHLFQYDQTHNITVLGSYRLGRGWELGARFRLISGQLATPVLRPPSLTALYASDAAAYTPLQGKPFSDRLPLFHQLDVRVDKGWQFRDFRLGVYLDVQNSYNNPAKESITYNYDFTQRTYQTGLPIIPSLGVRGEI